MTTLAEYMRWLRSQGGNCKNGIGPDEKRGMVPVIKMVSPDGQKHVIHGGDNQGEYLSPQTLNFLDRRLGLTSPFKR
jgi:hypothetical protein